MSGIIRQILNSGVFWAQAVTVLRTFGFIAVLIAGLRYMEPAELGLWYLLVNITQMGNAIELGFSATIARFASYFMTGRENIPEIGLAGAGPEKDEPNFPRLAGLVSMAAPLYRRFSLLVAFNILILGGLFLSWSDPPKITRAPEWISLVILGAGSALNMSGLFWHTMLNGINQVKTHHMLTAIGLVAGYAFSIAGLIAGLGLTAMALGLVLMNFIPRFFARRLILPRVENIPAQPVSSGLLWPMTWRSGTAGIAAYMTLAFTTVITAETCGLEVAGQYGLCMQLALALHSFAASWLAVKMPLLAQLFSQGRLDTVRSICAKRIGLGLLTFSAGAIVILLATGPLLALIGSKTAPLPIALFAGLLALVGLDLWVGFHAAAIQSANRISHLRIFVATALASNGLSMLLGREWGLAGVMAGPLLAQLAGNYWYTPLLFWRTTLSRKAA